MSDQDVRALRRRAEATCSRADWRRVRDAERRLGEGLPSGSRVVAIPVPGPVRRIVGTPTISPDVLAAVEREWSRTGDEPEVVVAVRDGHDLVFACPWREIAGAGKPFLPDHRAISFRDDELRVSAPEFLDVRASSEGDTLPMPAWRDTTELLTDSGGLCYDCEGGAYVDVHVDLHDNSLCGLCLTSFEPWSMGGGKKRVMSFRRFLPDREHAELEAYLANPRCTKERHRRWESCQVAYARGKVAELEQALLEARHSLEAIQARPGGWSIDAEEDETRARENAEHRDAPPETIRETNEVVRYARETQDGAYGEVSRAEADGSGVAARNAVARAQDENRRRPDA